MRALVAGYGRMGGFHAKVLRDLGYHVTTVDPDPDRRADFLDIDDAIPPWTLEQAMSGDRPDPFDVAAVAVPPEHIVDTAYRLAGLPMLVEKPFALTVRDARMLAAYLQQQGSKVCVGLVERFNPQARALRSLIREGAFREITHVKFTRWNDRPSFDVGLDLRLHDVDLMQWIGRLPSVEFDTRDRCDRKIRRVDVTHAEGITSFDLMDHALSPLHGMWHAFLTDGKYPTPDHAISALEVLPLTYKHEAVAA